MGISNSKLLAIYHLAVRYKSDRTLPTKFSHALIRNKNKAKELIDTFNELRTPPEKYAEYEEKRIALCVNACKKDKDGNPIIANDQYVVEEDKRSDLDKKVEELRTGEYKDVLAEVDRKEKEIKALMDGDSEIEIFKVDEEFLPKQMSPEDFEIIEPMVNFK